MAIFSPAPSAPTTYASFGFTSETSDDNYVVSYDPGSGSYTLASPFASGRIDENSAESDNTFRVGLIFGAANATSFVAFRTGPTNPVIDLRYSSFAWLTAAWDYGPYALVVFGQGTPPGAVPMTGNATYQALAYGSTLGGNYAVTGSARLNFDFSAGTLGGYFDPVLSSGDSTNLPRLNFINTVFGSGSTTFSGGFDSPLGGPNGFVGRFTGPTAEELIGRFQAPYQLPSMGQPSTMFGIWLGKQ